MTILAEERRTADYSKGKKNFVERGVCAWKSGVGGLFINYPVGGGGAIKSYPLKGAETGSRRFWGSGSGH